MKTQTTFRFLMVALIAVFVIQSADATIWRVNNNPPYNQWTNHEVFNSINAAIGSPDVLRGDTLLVESSGINYGSVRIDKKLTIIGTGYFLNEIPLLQNHQSSASVTKITFDSGSDSSIIIGLKVIGSTGVDRVEFEDATLNNITVTRCFIQDGIVFGNTSISGNTQTLSNILITKNYVGGDIDIPTSEGPIYGLVITNNYLGGDVNLGIIHYGQVSQNVMYNGNKNFYNTIDFYNNICIGGAILENSSNSDTNIYNNLFSINRPTWLSSSGTNTFGVPAANIFPTTGTTEGKLIPLPSCTTCFNGGYNNGCNTIMGLFGGCDSYTVHGIPSVPTIYQLYAPSNVRQGGTITVNIKTRSNN